MSAPTFAAASTSTGRAEAKRESATVAATERRLKERIVVDVGSKSVGVLVGRFGWTRRSQECGWEKKADETLMGTLPGLEQVFIRKVLC